MKTRKDYVSNSSSSSFILGGNKLLAFYGVSIKDIDDALVALYGEDECKKYQDKSWNTARDLPFKTYALPGELDQALKDYGTTLSEFSAGSSLGNWFDREYETFLRTLCNAYNISLCSGSEDEIAYCKENGWEIPDAVAEVVSKVHRNMEVKTMKEAAQSKSAAVFVHFHENKIWQLKGVQEYGPKDVEEWSRYMDQKEIEAAKTRKWTTRAFTSLRVYEVLLLKLVEMGKIKLDDAAVLGKIYPADEQAKKDFPNCKSWFPNDVYTAEEFADESELGFVGHEG